MTHPIEIEKLTKFFAKKMAVRKLSLSVPEGTFMGFFGPNGAGKTTTIKAMLNIIPPTCGRVRVLGTPSKKLGPAEFRRIGYVSENQELPLWMTLRQLVDYCKPMYPTWDDALCSRLEKLFELPPANSLRSYSRGMRMKASLLSSLAYRPELMVLDEPFGGLDPLSRDQFVEGLLDLAGKHPFTLFVSSHDIAEVERLCDAITFVNQGTATLSESTDSLLRRFRRVELTGCKANNEASHPENWRAVKTNGNRMTFVETAFEGEADEQARVRAALPNATVRAVQAMTLREVVVFLSTQGKGAHN